VSSVIANLTVVNPSAAGSAVVYASNATQPAVTSSTWAAGQTVGTLVTTKIGADGYIKITNTSAGTIDVAVDVQGWYSTGTPTTGTVLTAVNPARVVSTVAPTTGTCSPSPCTAWTTTAGTKDVKIAGLGGVPATGVAAVAVTITVTNNSTTATDTVTAWAGGSASAQPANVTNLTIAPGQTLSNEAVVPLTGWLAAPQGYINLNTSTASDALASEAPVAALTDEQALSLEGRFGARLPRRRPYGPFDLPRRWQPCMVTTVTLATR